MSRRRWPDSLELQDRLNTSLLQGRKSAVQLNKHIRRLKSVRAFVLNEKDRVKTELNEYVNRLLESLLDFKSEILQQLENVVMSKEEELFMIKSGLEENIDTLSTLCEETEKLLQFDCEISTHMDRHKAQTLEKAFRMLPSQGDQLELGDVMTLRFVPAVDVANINVKAFGCLYPSISGNGSQERLQENSSNDALKNLNCTEHVACNIRNDRHQSSSNKLLKCDFKNVSDIQHSSNRSKKCELKDVSVDKNMNFKGTVVTDVNCNPVTNCNSVTYMPQPSSTKNCVTNIDPAEVSAYLNEFKLVEANNTVDVCLMNQPLAQSIPLAQGSSMNYFQVHNIPFPEVVPVNQFPVQYIQLPDGMPLNQMPGVTIQQTHDAQIVNQLPCQYIPLSEHAPINQVQGWNNPLTQYAPVNQLSSQPIPLNRDSHLNQLSNQNVLVTRSAQPFLEYKIENTDLLKHDPQNDGRSVRPKTPPPPGFIRESQKKEQYRQSDMLETYNNRDAQETSCSKKDSHERSHLEIVGINRETSKVDSTNAVMTKFEKAQKANICLDEKLEICSHGIYKIEPYEFLNSETSLNTSKGSTFGNVKLVQTVSDLSKITENELESKQQSECVKIKTERSLNDLEYSSDEEENLSTSKPQDKEVEGIIIKAKNENATPRSTVECQRKDKYSGSQIETLPDCEIGESSAQYKSNIEVEGNEKCDKNAAEREKKSVMLDNEKGVWNYTIMNNELLAKKNDILKSENEKHHFDIQEKCDKQTCEELLKKAIVEKNALKPLRRPMSLPRIPLFTKHTCNSLNSMTYREMPETHSERHCGVDTDNSAVKQGNQREIPITNSKEHWDVVDVDTTAVKQGTKREMSDTKLVEEWDVIDTDTIAVKQDTHKEMTETFSVEHCDDTNTNAVTWDTQRQMPESDSDMHWDVVDTPSSAVTKGNLIAVIDGCAISEPTDGKIEYFMTNDSIKEKLPDKYTSAGDCDIGAVEINRAAVVKEPNTAVKQDSSCKKDKYSKLIDNRTATEKNIDALICQTSWCKKFIRKTLSPSAKRKFKTDTVVKTEGDIAKTPLKNNKFSTEAKGRNDVETETLKQAQINSGTETLTGCTQNDKEKLLKNSKLNGPFGSQLPGGNDISQTNSVSSNYTSESWDLELENHSRTNTNNSAAEYMNNSYFPCLSDPDSGTFGIVCTTDDERNPQRKNEECGPLENEKTSIKTNDCESWDLELENGLNANSNTASYVKNSSHSDEVTASKMESTTYSETDPKRTHENNSFQKVKSLSTTKTVESESWDLELEEESRHNTSDSIEVPANKHCDPCPLARDTDKLSNLVSTSGNERSPQTEKAHSGHQEIKKTSDVTNEGIELWDVEAMSNQTGSIVASDKTELSSCSSSANFDNGKKVKTNLSSNAETKWAASDRMDGGQAHCVVDVLENYRISNKKTAIRGKIVTTVGYKGKGTSSGLFFPIGVTTNSSGDIIVTDTGNHLVKLYNKEGIFVKTIGKQCFPPMRRPSAAVVNERDELFVKDDICIRVFDKTGLPLRDIGYKHFTRPFGLALTSAGTLVVLDTNYHFPCLIHMSQDGSNIRKYPYRPLHGVSAASKCRFMAVSGEKVIVSDLGLSNVYITDLQGHFLRVIGQYGHGPMQFCEPSGIAVDRYGNIIVGDSRNNKVKVWHYDGTFFGAIEFSDQIIRPSGIHLTDDSKVLVSNYLHHQVKVFKLEA